METGREICEPLLADTARILILDLPEVFRLFLGCLPQWGTIQYRREKTAFRYIRRVEKIQI